MTKEDQILKMIQKEQRVPRTTENGEILDRLEEKGLVKGDLQGHYELTRYGELITQAGYDTYKKTEDFEREISRKNPGGIQKEQILILLIAISLIFFLVALLIITQDSL